MIRKLRIKFVVINMTIVTAMLCFIFSLLYSTTRSNLERESIQTMRSIALDPIEADLARSEDDDNVRLPYFSVMVNHAGESIGINGGFFDTSDDEEINMLLQMTYDSHTTSGIISEYQLRYYRAETPIGYSVVFADITHEQSMLNHLIRNFLITGSLAFIGFFIISILLSQWATRPVEKAFEQQKQFIADASHELKTPLTVIMADAELLSTSTQMDEESIVLSKSILTMSGQMRDLVVKMLDLARIDSVNNAKIFSPVDFSEITLSSSMIYEPVLFERDLSFDYDISPKIMVRGDSSQLKQLVDILLDNASKYTSEQGRIILTLHQIQRKKCLLQVSSEGLPIEDEDIKNLFKRFYRVDKARTSSSHSYGLGLSIASSIAKSHHGKIFAESKEGFNSFYVELPVS